MLYVFCSFSFKRFRSLLKLFQSVAFATHCFQDSFEDFISRMTTEVSQLLTVLGVTEAAPFYLSPDFGYLKVSGECSNHLEDLLKSAAFFSLEKVVSENNHSTYRHTTELF